MEKKIVRPLCGLFILSWPACIKVVHRQVLFRAGCWSRLVGGRQVSGMVGRELLLRCSRLASEFRKRYKVGWHRSFLPVIQTFVSWNGGIKEQRGRVTSSSSSYMIRCNYKSPKENVLGC